MLDHQAIKQINLQRYPIALLDRITEYTPGQSIVALKAVTASEPCFAQVADDAPEASMAYPQSLLIESFCQAAGPLCRHSGLDFTTNTMLFVSMSGVEFLHPVYPGQVMQHRVHIEKVLSDAVTVAGTCVVDGVVVARFEQLLIAARKQFTV